MATPLDIPQAAKRLMGFIRKTVTDAGYQKVVLGISGGVDSSLSAALGAKALGPENVLGVIMPYRTSSPQSEADAREMADKIGIAVEKVDITPMVDAYFQNRESSEIRIGNKCARERMSILFDIASRDGRLVIGTSNKTEIALGYSTLFGDGACSFNPLGGLYKRDVQRMAGYLGVPKPILNKAPSADLWPGQTDEEELGLTYEMADEVLGYIIEDGIRSMDALKQSGAEENVIREIIRRVNSFIYKRSPVLTYLLDTAPIPDHIEIDG